MHDNPVAEWLAAHHPSAGVVSLLASLSAAGCIVLLQGCSSGGADSPPASITVSVSPRATGLTLSQALSSLTATTNDSAGVKWSISPSGGSFSATSSLSGAQVTFSAPASPGVYTITATSVTDPSVSASATIGVTNLTGVYTYHDDLARDGANSQEYALTTANVATGTFGKLFSCTVDGAIYAQPLWVAQVSIGGALHNAVYVATAHDSLYAFDADTSPCVQLWSVSLLDANHGGTAGETTVPSGPTGYKVGAGGGDITPEVGVIGTPVIDPGSKVLLVVSKSMNSAGSTFYQRLHAIDITTGKESFGGPILITATYPGTGDGGTSTAFNAQQENQRPGLALVNGTVYIAWAAHEDVAPWYGWIVGYTYGGGSLRQSQILNVAPNVGEGGIWMSGGAPAADSSGNLYVITGNAQFDANSQKAPNNDYGDSFLKLSGALAVQQYFTPSDEVADYANDNDFGSGGAAVLADLPAGAPATHLLIGGGKDGNLYVLNRDAMGGFGDQNAWQEIMTGSGLYATAALWNNNLYIAPASRPLTTYSLNTTTAQFGAAGATSSHIYDWPGSTPSVSASGSSNGIVWAVDTSQYCTSQAPGCGPAVLHAYDATNVATELWNSSNVSTDAAGNAVKFVTPTVANGKVYVGTRGNNTGGAYGSTSVSGELDVYGLEP